MLVLFTDTKRTPQNTDRIDRKAAKVSICRVYVRAILSTGLLLKASFKAAHHVEREFAQHRKANKRVPHHGNPLEKHLQILFPTTSPPAACTATRGAPFFLYTSGLLLTTNTTVASCPATPLPTHAYSSSTPSST